MIRALRGLGVPGLALLCALTLGIRDAGAISCSGDMKLPVSLNYQNASVHPAFQFVWSSGTVYVVGCNSRHRHFNYGNSAVTHTQVYNAPAVSGGLKCDSENSWAYNGSFVRGSMGTSLPGGAIGQSDLPGNILFSDFRTNSANYGSVTKRATWVGNPICGSL